MQARRLRLARVSVILCAAIVAPLTARADNIVTGVSDLGPLSTPLTLTYGHAFNDLDPIAPGLQLAGVPATVNSTDTFYDDYAFTVGGSSFSTITATIDLGQFFDIGNLQVRLFRGTPATIITGPTDPNLLSAWSTALTAEGSGTGEVQVILPHDLSPDNYVLEVRGNILGSSGGAYAGVLNLAPVPEPGPIGLALAGGAILLGLMRRGKDRDAR